jgi:hypothetical protein
MLDVFGPQLSSPRHSHTRRVQTRPACLFKTAWLTTGRRASSSQLVGTVEVSMLMTLLIIGGLVIGVCGVAAAMWKGMEPAHSVTQILSELEATSRK